MTSWCSRGTSRSARSASTICCRFPAWRTSATCRGERILGLSKLARIVGHFAARPQMQERMTRQIADFLDHELCPAGAGVVLEAEHTCMTMRGVRSRGASTVTSALTGVLRADAQARTEFLALVENVPGPARRAQLYPGHAADYRHS